MFYTRDPQGNESWQDVEIPPGTVTSVELAVPEEFTSNGPVTSRGALRLGKKNLSPGMVYATPSSGDGPLAPRQLQNEHLPVVDIRHGGTGKASLPEGLLVATNNNLDALEGVPGVLHFKGGYFVFAPVKLSETFGVLSIDKGGTGASSQREALKALLPQGKDGDFLGVIKGEAAWMSPTFAPLSRIRYKANKVAYPADGELIVTDQIRLADGESIHAVVYVSTQNGAAGYMLSYGDINHAITSRSNKVEFRILRSQDIVIIDDGININRYPASSGALNIKVKWEFESESIAVLGAAIYHYK